MQEAVYPNEVLLRGGVRLVGVGQHAGGLGGVCVGGVDGVLRERRRGTSRKFDCATISGMVYDI